MGSSRPCSTLRCSASMGTPRPLCSLPAWMSGSIQTLMRRSYEVIRKGSAVHCVSAYEGDILVVGSDGVFDNLFLDEIIDACNDTLPPLDPGEPFAMRPASVLRGLAKRLVLDAHKKSGEDGRERILESPIGKGGKVDDASVVVAEV